MLSQTTISIIQISIQFLGLTSIIILVCQIRSSVKWNRRFNSQNKIDQKYLRDNYAKLAEAGINIGCKVLEKEDATKITEDKDLKSICEEILNYLEEVSISFNLKMVDKKYAYHAYSEDIFHAHDFFKPLIDSEDEGQLFFSELKKCYKNFKKIHNFEVIKSLIKNYFVGHQY